VTSEEVADLEFEVFSEEIMKPESEVAVSIQKGGVLALSPGAYAALGEPAAVELLFARRERVMGLRPANPERVPHAYKVRRHKASRSHLISGRRYVRHYGIETEKATRYRAMMSGDVLTVPLGADADAVSGAAQPPTSDR
jgi:hypothetical protein